MYWKLSNCNVLKVSGCNVLETTLWSPQFGNPTVSFQIDASSMTSDWMSFKERQFDWLRASQGHHQFKTLSKRGLLEIFYRIKLNRNFIFQTVLIVVCFYCYEFSISFLTKNENKTTQRSLRGSLRF